MSISLHDRDGPSIGVIPLDLSNQAVAALARRSTHLEGPARASPSQVQAARTHDADRSDHQYAVSNQVEKGNGEQEEAPNRDLDHAPTLIGHDRKTLLRFRREGTRQRM